MPPNGERRGLRPVGAILDDLFAARGWSRRLAAGELEHAWADAVGESRMRLTRLGAVRKGVLGVTVAHSALLQELAGFEKQALIAALKRNAPAAGIRDIRFRLGSVSAEEK